jgi:hypothetical protein
VFASPGARTWAPEPPACKRPFRRVTNQKTTASATHRCRSRESEPRLGRRRGRGTSPSWAATTAPAPSLRGSETFGIPPCQQHRRPTVSPPRPTDLHVHATCPTPPVCRATATGRKKKKKRAKGTKKRGEMVKGESVAGRYFERTASRRPPRKSGNPSVCSAAGNVIASPCLSCPLHGFFSVGRPGRGERQEDEKLGAHGPRRHTHSKPSPPTLSLHHHTRWVHAVWPNTDLRLSARRLGRIHLRGQHLRPRLGKEERQQVDTFLSPTWSRACGLATWWSAAAAAACT